MPASCSALGKFRFSERGGYSNLSFLLQELSPRAALSRSDAAPSGLSRQRVVIPVAHHKPMPGLIDQIGVTGELKATSACNAAASICRAPSRTNWSSIDPPTPPPPFHSHPDPRRRPHPMQRLKRGQLRPRVAALGLSRCLGRTGPAASRARRAAHHPAGSFSTRLLPLSAT